MSRHKRRNEKMTDRARALRRDSPTPERLLWGRLRGRRLLGLKFRRQHAVAPYVIDFYCHEARLAVELDGMTHMGTGDRDDARTEALQRQGIDVIRVTNDEVIADIDVVLQYIAREAQRRIPLPPGEGAERSEAGEGGCGVVGRAAEGDAEDQGVRKCPHPDPLP